MKAFAIALITFFSLFLYCAKASAQTCKKTGVAGFVTEVIGNQMPDPNEPQASAKGYKTTVYVYQLTNLSQVERKGNEPAYTAIRTKLVRKVNSTSKGYFFAKLPAGQYSLFVKVNDLFYTNSFDEKNNINPVTVEGCQVAQLNIRIDAGATY